MSIAYPWSVFLNFLHEKKSNPNMRASDVYKSKYNKEFVNSINFNDHPRNIKIHNFSTISHTGNHLNYLWLPIISENDQWFNLHNHWKF